MEFYCPNCGEITPATGKFCKECAYDLRKSKLTPTIDYTEPQSYTPKHLADKIFTTRSSIEGERKVVTVLFADVANSTAMFENIDPEDVHAIMDGCFKILMDEIHGHEGTINQFRGDGVMAIFGAPLAHEDHAQRACYAALAIQKVVISYAGQLKERHGIDFKMRVGLNSGPVVVGSIGDDLRMDYTADGDVTNLASRMESSAGPGKIMVSSHTYRLVEDYFEFEFTGNLRVKGKEKPQAAYNLLKPSEVETRIEASRARGLTKFIGRENSIERLLEAFAKSQSGSGQVVGIVGEAGVGKSRLLLELRNRFSQDEYIYLEGRCLHYGGSMAYLPILDILKSYFQIGKGELEREIRKKLKEKIFDLDEDLKGIFSPLQELLSLKVEDEKYLRLQPMQKRDKTFEGLRDLLIRMSQEKPLILAVEDLHWIDNTSQDFLDYLIGWLANTRILIILLYRPEYAHSWGSKSYYGKIGLDELSTASSTELVQAILQGGEPVPELRDLILNRTGGNPLFVEEFTHALLENDAIQKEGCQYVLSRIGSELQVPDTIRGIIAARMDRLDESLKRIVQVASVIGREFAFRVLQAITGMREELKSCLLNLQALEFIYEKSLFPELEYMFKHALTQEVAYSSLLLKRRREIHEKIGRAIEELYSDSLEEYYGLLAFHYERAEIRDKALHYLRLAADRAKAIYANEEAIAFYRAAIEQVSQFPREERELDEQWHKMAIQVYERLGDVLELTGQHHEARKAYESAVVDDSKHDPIRQSHLHRKTGNTWREQRRYKEAMQAYNHAETILGLEPAESAPGWWQAWIEIQNDRMWLLYWQAQFQLMSELAAKARPIVEKYGTPVLRSRFFQGLFLMCQRRDRYVISEETLSHAQASLEAIQESGNKSAIALSQFALGLGYLCRDDLDEADKNLRAALKLAERIGDIVVQSRCLTYLTILYRKRGRTEEVEHYISRALAVAAAGNMLEYISTAKANLAWVSLREGNLCKAQENGQAALEMWRKAPLVYPFQWTALWPLIGVALNKEEISAAVDYACALLQPSQQRLPDSINTILEEAIKGWGEYETAKVRINLNRAVELAQELGWF